MNRVPTLTTLDVEHFEMSVYFLYAKCVIASTPTRTDVIDAGLVALPLKMF